MTTYIAFASTQELRRDSMQLLANIDARSKESQAELMTRIIHNFTDEILQAFFLDMVNLLELSPFMARVVNGSVTTIRETIHTVSSRILHRLDNRQLMPLSDYMSSVMLTANDAAGQPQPYVGFPVHEATEQRLTKLITAMRQGDPKAQRPELKAMLNEITDLSLEIYLLTPIELLKLNFLLRKLAEGSVAVIRGAIHLVIGRLLPDLDDRQLLEVANYLEGMILRNGRPYR